MVTYLVAFCLACLAALAFTPAVRWAAFRFGLVDAPADPRKVHRKPIPRVGGVGIAAAFFLPVFGLLFVDNDVSDAYISDPWRVGGLVGGAGAMVGLGLLDDLFNLSARLKFVAQVLVAMGVWWCGFSISQVATPFGVTLDLGLLALPVTVIWIVGVINAINLIDGLDGLASGVALFTVLTLFALSLVNANVIVGLTAASLAGALIGFLRYNFNPASIFMGDSGSLFLGFVLATTGIWGSAKSSTVVALMIPLLALGLPLFDTSMAIVRRFLAGRPVFSADRGHVHHRLLDLGLSHRQVVLALYGVCLVFTLLALSLVFANSLVSAVVLGMFLVAVLVFAKMVGLLDFRSFQSSIQYGLMRQQRGRAHLVAIERAVEQVRNAGDVPALVQILETVADDVRIDEMHLHAIFTPEGTMSAVEAEWHRENTNPGEELHAQHLEHVLDWSLGHVGITGRMTFVWHCAPDALQIPEGPGYHLLALAVRDRLLQLAVEVRAVPLGPRLVATRPMTR
jgi:UDP-GlcNAc:undecaprenyl-phosphate GlcNAc-1-phosphate transferase